MYQNTYLSRSRGGSFSKTLNGKQHGPLSPIFTPGMGSVRETGIVDKLMHSFGFITCCERNESIFFHFSQYNGNADELRAGDEVEFEVGTDTRTGKLIGRRLVKLPTGTVSFESISEERLLGKVDCEPRIISSGEAERSKRASKSHMDPGMGRIIYERTGEYFFVPYAFTDVNDESEIHKGDEVSFYMAKNKRTGALRARLVRLVQPAKVETVQGVVKTLKDSFGFIERADMIKDIFFHYSELSPGMESNIVAGSSVEFIVQNRQGKEVATQLKILSPGSVQFDTIAVEELQGAVKQPVIRSFTHGRGKEPEPITGEIIYQSDMEGLTTLPYSDKDQVGDYTMFAGDIVHFRIATDRRDGSRRATCVQLHRLIEDQKERTGREKGIVAALRDGFGFIRCAERDTRMFFHFNEVIDTDRKLAQHDEVEFSIQNDYTNERLHAVRIRILPRGSVQFESVSEQVFEGTVEGELSAESGRNKPNVLKIQTDGDHGTIRHIDQSGEEAMVNFYWCPEVLQFGDMVDFCVATRSYDGLKYAVDIAVVQRARDIRFRGFIATLKDSYGFIESEEHDCELFFPFSSCNRFCNPRDLEVMDEVEYCIVRKSNKLAADEIKKLPRGSIPTEEVKPGLHEGVVQKPMKSTDNPLDYEGVIKLVSSGSNKNPPPSELPYSITSITDHRIALQEGDMVQFQVGVSPHGGDLRAVNICSKKEFIRGTIESVKEQYGFINYQGEDHSSESIFFHMNSVANGCDFSDLHPGDEVEFLITFSQKAQKNSANYVKKLSASVRPERLMKKPSTPNSHAVSTVIRQPRGPDDTRGFVARRSNEQ